MRLGADPSLRLEAARLAIRVGDRTDGRRRLAELVLDPGCGETSERALADLVALVPEPRSRFTDAERARVADAARRWVDDHPARAFDLVQALHPDPAPLAARSPSEALVESEALRRLGRLGEAERLLLRAAQGDAETRAGAPYLAARLDLARGRRSRYRAGLDLVARSPGDTRGKRQALLDLAEIADGRPTADALSAYRRYREAVGSRDQK